MELWDTDVCFLHIQLIGTNVRLSKIHRNPARLIQSLQIRPQSLRFGTIPVDNAVPRDPPWQKLSVIMCVMNVRNQTSQAFVTSSCPFCNCSSKFVYGPKNVRSTSSCQVQAFPDYLWAYLFSCRTVSSSSFLKLWSSKHGFATLYNCSFFFFASSQHLSTQFWACPSMS